MSEIIGVLNLLWTALLPILTGLIGYLGGIYTKDYRQDRNWCRDVEATLADIATAAEKIRTTNEYSQATVKDHAIRLEELIASTPPYRHPIRRELESLNDTLKELKRINRYGPPLRDDGEVDPDAYGDVDRIEYIIEEADALRDQVYEVERQLSYGPVAMLPKFVAHNVVPS